MGYQNRSKMTYDAEKLVPYSDDEKKGVQVERMFDSIAEHYDTLNHTLSMGIDKGWRKKGITALKAANPKTILDIATGTGDLSIQAFDILKPNSILATDISEGMMGVGRLKVEKIGLKDKITFAKEDCMNLSLEDSSFDAAMVAFGIRNFEDLDKGLKEIRRVLKPGGELMILELTSPQHFPMKQAFWIYSHVVIPVMGRLISKDKAAYVYLPKSIQVFIQGKEMVDTLLKNGFSKATHKAYTFGICTMYKATK